MTPDRWQQIKDVFYAALERPPGERSSFLDSACAGNSQMREEVSQLISVHEQSGEFLDVPAFEAVARSIAATTSRELSEGQVVGHYRIFKRIGAGGMGEVYLAEDNRLGRKVALKLLQPFFTTDVDRVRRFEREACAASALNHPNVCVIHEIGETEERRQYIVMEYVEGITLRRWMQRSRMELKELLDLAIQIASGIAAAHSAGVVHRDVKPENIMIRADGLVKVLDFGLAKLTEQPSIAVPPAPTGARVQTETGTVMGTASYMSPEQARGLDVDARTDIWSLGIVLYEMASGHVPFQGETPSHVIVSILEHDLPPLSSNLEVPAGLERIVAKALHKKKEERYPTASDLAVALKSLKEEWEIEARLKAGLESSGGANEIRDTSEGFGGTDTKREVARTGPVDRPRMSANLRRLVSGLKRRQAFAVIASLILLIGAISLAYFTINRNKTAPGAHGKKSIAVLPLKPINTGVRDEIYEIGIADSLIYRLSASKGLVVRPLSATRKYNDVAQDPLAAGKEQQADYVLASNYQLAAGKIRVTAQLFNVSTGQVEETYKSEKDAGDIFVMQDAIAGEVGDLLLGLFAPISKSSKAKRDTTNEEAYRLYLQGMYLAEKEGRAEAKRAVELFDQALSLDPNYAKAWAGKARAHCTFAHLGGSSPAAEFEKAKPALDRAFALDANLAEAYGTLGTIRNDYDWDFAEADKDFLRAIELAPNSDSIHRWYANRLAGQGRSEEAIATIKIAIDLNPSAVSHQIWYGRALYYARQYDDAITQLLRVIELDSTSPLTYYFLWHCYHMKGDYPRAYQSFMRFQQSIRTNDETLKSYETAYTKRGWLDVLSRNLEIAKASATSGSAAYNVAELSALVGQREQALRYLDEAANKRASQISSIGGDPGLDSLRGDPRFDDLVKRCCRRNSPQTHATFWRSESAHQVQTIFASTGFIGSNAIAFLNFSCAFPIRFV